MNKLNNRNNLLFKCLISEMCADRVRQSESLNPIDYVNSIQKRTLAEIFTIDPSSTSDFYEYFLKLCGSEDLFYQLMSEENQNLYKEDLEKVCDVITDKINEFGEIYVGIALEQEDTENILYFFR
ncbi:hypothetical protein [Vibrio parahaemolyticus]|uniref:hypothetical protein n=2 Tax=Vibrio parahaemolyticus TaxID=670 RepID=UPI0005C4F6BE|nr:hypothetical protein ACX10_15300 [Vibrio parahaemolyticus]